MRVLIVEDDQATREMLERGLREELFQVVTAVDGTQAEGLAATGTFDVILLDMILPDHDGLMVCRRLRARQVDTPVMLLSGRSALEDRVRGLDAGADDYLVKPFAFAEVLARVRALTRRGRTRNLHAILEYGPIELDQRDHVAKLNGSVLDLSMTELRLLEYFLRRPEAVVTREELAHHVWGHDIDSESNVIDVYVSYLRKKLKPAGRPLLRTVRRTGYKLSNEPA